MHSISRRQFIRVMGGTAFAFASFSELEKALATVTTSKGVLVEAESFANRGGWMRDTQFIHQMGGVYLLAHGLGKPVENASTKATFKEDGTYRVLVRCKDWCPGEWESPGRFKVLVNGKPLDKVFGAGGQGWGWEDGGEIAIEAGELTLELQDMTGFDGRCDAIYFTKVVGDVPPNDPVELLKWKDAVAGREVGPLKALDFDVVIVGGGMAGCGAALAAESQGLKVALVQDRPMLGGNASAEIRVHTIGIAGKNEALIGRIDTKHYPNGHADALQDQMKRDREMANSNVSIFVDHRAIGLEMNGDQIVSVDARQNGTGAITRFKAPVFIDCTGDAWLGHWSGAEKRYGRESKNEFSEYWDKHGELWSPEKPDNQVMGTSLLWNSTKTDTAQPFPSVPWAKQVAKNHIAIKGDWEWEYTANHLHQVEDAEQIRDHLLRAIFGSFANAKKDPKNATTKLEWVAYVGGKRESWRLIGDYIFTQSDAKSGTEFPDAVVEETREIDVHFQMAVQKHPVDFLSKALFMKTPKYFIPFRCLYSKNIANLMMAGRNFSCSHIGLGGPRVMKTCAQMGVAVGYAAALCKKHSASPREVGLHHIKELRSLIGYA